MTAIAAIKHDGKVWMAGDAAGVGGYSLQVRKDPKVFINDEFIIGYTSSFRMGQLLRFNLSAPKPTEGVEAFEYMCTHFVPAIRKLFKDGGYAEVSEGRESAGTFLVGWRGELYLIHSDYQVAELQSDYCACGCGDDLALGSLYSTAKSKMTPKSRLLLAMEAAEAFSAGVRGPFTVVSK